ncbi:MAG TPA: rhodoquinone biosynthesis methyltransferase RquA [Xanthobacteraceae bacterium]|nr:rhodoquinone biosynthesis methyltransferase RquA [Xanthobacteraceae bacterium]
MQPELTFADEASIGTVNRSARGRAAAQALRLPAPIELAVPTYLISHYWWAYVHPRAVHVFERPWLVNLILWGNYPRLRDAALAELGDTLPGATLQVACVYGDLTERLCERAAAGQGRVDVVDVLSIQLENLRKKLPADAAAVRLLAMNSADLHLPAEGYERALVFFLLHEQPRHVRERTLSEVARVVKPGGKIVIVDYARPRWWNPLRYIWGPVLALLEPFALDLWHNEIAVWLPNSCTRRARVSFFGGLYQKLVLTRLGGVPKQGL